MKRDQESLQSRALAISVVIPTHNRYKQLFSLLQSLRECAPPSVIETIVVDDSDVPSENLATTFSDMKLKHITTTGRLYISKSKNIGWRKAVGDFVFFIDDDNVVSAETFPRLLNKISELPEVGAIMPAVVYKSSPEIVWVYYTPYSKDRWSHILIGRNQPRNQKLEGQYVETDALPNAFLARKSALLSVNGFDELLPVNSSADLAGRLKQTGYCVLADTGSFIYHDVPPPSENNFWVRHGLDDPDRVFYEFKDWFVLMRRNHKDEWFFTPRALFHSARFALPNTLAYLVLGRGKRSRLLFSVVRGTIYGLKKSGQ